MLKPDSEPDAGLDEKIYSWENMIKNSKNVLKYTDTATYFFLCMRPNTAPKNKMLRKFREKNNVFFFTKDGVYLITNTSPKNKIEKISRRKINDYLYKRWCRPY
jgi:hypothetical protein